MQRKLLIIEDERNIRALLLQILEEAFEDYIDKEELVILEALNGEQGLQLAREEKPDLIFSDVMMPKIDGFEVCRVIKKDPELVNAYIVLLTAKGQEFDKTEGTDSGCDEYITKPFGPDLIVSKVEERLGFKRID